MRALAKLHAEEGIWLHTTQRPKARGIKGHDDLLIIYLQTMHAREVI